MNTKEHIVEKKPDTLKEDIISRLDRLSRKELCWVYTVVLELTREA